MTAPVIILQNQTIAAAPEDWTRSIPFNQFDPSNGALIDANFTTAGSLVVSASIENLSPAAASISLLVSGAIVATAPAIGVVGSITPVVGSTINLGGFQGTFDGTVDFASASGTVLAAITGAQTQTAAFNTGSVGTAPFVGTGTFDVNVSSHATSTVYGNGNLAIMLHSSAGAVLSLEYDAASPGTGSSSTGSAAGGVDTFTGFPISISNNTTTAPRVVIFQSRTSGWTDVASVTRFDPSLGTLDEVILNVGNTVSGSFSAENLSGVAGSVNMTETASMTVTAPGFSTGVTATAAGGDNVSLGAFDGSADFAGSSGRVDTIADNPAADNPGLWECR